MAKKKTILASSFLYLALFLVLLFSLIAVLSNDDKNDFENNWANPELDESTDEIRKFSSSSELTAFIKENSQNINSYSKNSFQSIGTEVATEDFSTLVKSTISEVARDYSQTNNQVDNVDEADYIKNDDKYIYTIVQDKLVIVDAYPANNANIVSETKIEGMPQNIFLNDDRIAIISTNYENVYSIAEFDFMPRKRQESQTIVYVYDISNREEPKLIKDYSMTGNYYDARMIDDYIYFIAKENIYYSGGPVPLPGVRQNNILINNPEVYYFDNPENNYVFHTIGAFNIFEDRQKFEAKTFMLGYSNNLYVSENNIYITYQKNYASSFYQYQKVDIFFNVIVPLLPEKVALEVKKVEDSLEYNSMDSYVEAWDKISILLENMYNYMKEEEKKALVEEIEKAVSEFKTKIEDERSLSIIHKLGIKRDEITYKARGEVKGYLLNQFSLDENEDDILRVATTTNFFTDGKHVQYNNVYILDKDLSTIGKLEKLAPDEKIYSTRFMGDKLYMVTFKQVDPLFTIDLSDDNNPKIIGQLKVPGFSSYLHPYDETHLIGIGQDTYEDNNGNIRTKGIKLSLFDVSDFENPKEVDTVIIGDSGSYSEVLNDHKALLFNKDKNLLVLPVREVDEKYKTDENGYFRNKVWNGAYAFTITSHGFKERGKISHFENEDNYWDYSSNVRRSLFMDDNLYTISNKLIKINDLGTIDKIGEVKLPYEQNWYPYKYLYEEPIAIENDNGIGDGAEPLKENVRILEPNTN